MRNRISSFIVLLCAVALGAVAVTSPVSAASVASESKISGTANLTRGPWIATNGSTSVITWTEEVSDDASRVMASTKVGSGAWSKGTAVGALEYSGKWTNIVPAVSSTGRIFVAWEDDDDIRYREKVGTAAWGAEAALPGSASNGQWHDDLDVVANGEGITVVGVLSLTNALSVNSWTRATPDSDWVMATVADVPNGSELGTCSYNTVEQCQYLVDDIDIESNSSAVQVVAIQTHRETPNYTMNGSRWTMQAIVRNGLSDVWSAPQVIDSMRPGKNDEGGYAYFLDNIVVTPNGKAAIAWYRGVDSTGYEGRVALKSGANDVFTLQDTKTFTAGFATMDAFVGNLGNSIFVTWKAASTARAEYIQKIGSVGNLAKTTKNFSLDGNWDLQSFFVKDGDFAALLAPDMDTTNTGAWTTVRKSDGSWATPIKRTLTTPGFYISRYAAFDIATTSTEQVLVFAKQTGACPRCELTGIYVTAFK